MGDRSVPGESGVSARESGVSARETAVSAREADVLAALAEHLTNAEIAARLFISVRTVESHVSPRSPSRHPAHADRLAGTRSGTHGGHRSQAPSPSRPCPVSR